ncbi:MAG: dihydrodipicolinate synthase family protein [Gemmatimonadetes bacterium]|jgi:dihydrodipicolinate synthase/N-acetylneuraminate lyase|nr:dihydrodipicolinate synthase family protein [Gemmatimonadota bacterium]MBT6145958.1 dihydrodipicolinate synthase family protein [Gemmatimonadota bacterium]MBT7859161.1 dihydrodipicolinate synthase family protein [Gemmatimonadota bacterium]
MADTIEGIVPIIVTPFDEGLALDEASLQRHVEFCLAAGAGGLVGPANASEFATLSDDERRRWIQVVVSSADGAPVVASVTSGHLMPAIDLARYAIDAGVAAIMSMPPPLLKPDTAGCVDYFTRLAEAIAPIPLIVQNYAPPLGTPLTSATLAQLCQRVDNIEYIKEELPPETRMITSTLAAVGTACRGIFGGQGGIYLIDEFRRGAIGNMPGGHLTDVLVDVWRQLQEGEESAARRIHHQLLPLMTLERLYGVAIYKQILQRRGIFTTARRRAPGGVLDAFDLYELDAALACVEPLYRIGKGN